MIVIFSFDGDKSTNKLIDWLCYFKCKFHRFNLEDEDISKILISMDEGGVFLNLNIEGQSRLSFSDISYFYVRGKGFKLKSTVNTTNIPNEVFNKYRKSEFNSLCNYFYSLINKKSIGCFPSIKHDKLLQIQYAIEIGLKTPKTLISSKKSNLQLYFKKKSTITKAIQDNIGTEYDGWWATTNASGGADEELVTIGGRGDCSGAAKNCTDQMYDC